MSKTSPRFAIWYRGDHQGVLTLEPRKETSRGKRKRVVLNSIGREEPAPKQTSKCTTPKQGPPRANYQPSNDLDPAVGNSLLDERAEEDSFNLIGTDEYVSLEEIDVLGLDP